MMYIMKSAKSNLLNKLYTYRCKFKHDDVTIRSDVDNFQQISDQKYFNVADELNKTILEIEETQFASSKNFFYNLF